MQLTNLFTVAALAMTASALPAAENVDILAKRTTPAPTCSNNNQPVCCNGLLGVLLCAVSVVGGNCEGSSYCCETNAPVGSLINLQLLNCVHVG
ncbi:hypothetical protein C8A03DRAFT_34946 [Achaetomium macrosporum]|uniref:Hydrophobin n=1 Tax=Achaetomium macrosporum TaxID=79813 RepID=A0AAN7C900_9PEZI|nr:hypothetical protein C8A03DRAFT_34946 [Achaetomium macrosporum]